MKRLLAVILVFVSFSSVANNLGFEVGAALWHNEMKGSIETDLNQVAILSVDLEKDVSMKSTNSQIYYLDFYHPIPYLPNLYFSTSKIEHKGKGNPTLDQVILSQPPVDPYQTSIKGSLDISHYDVTAYWTPLDLAILRLDAGLTFRQFDGHIDFTLNSQDIMIRPTGDLDTQYILAYGKLNARIPIVGLSAFFKLNAGYNFDQDNPEKAFDMDLGLTYRTFLGLGATLGYRYFDVDLRSTAIASGFTRKFTYKLDSYGPYLSLSYRF